MSTDYHVVCHKCKVSCRGFINSCGSTDQIVDEDIVLDFLRRHGANCTPHHNANSSIAVLNSEMNRYPDEEKHE